VTGVNFKIDPSCYEHLWFASVNARLLLEPNYKLCVTCGISYKSCNNNFIVMSVILCCTSLNYFALNANGRLGVLVCS
jgi:hypothetical protein